MKIGARRVLRIVAVAWAAALFLGIGFRVLADCASFGLPFTDLGSETTFCAAIAEAYYAGLTNGTSGTTYSPSDNVTREQMAAFITRTLDASLYRGARRAALDQWWTTTPHYDLGGLGSTALGGSESIFVKSDGTDLWVADNGGSVYRVRASDGKKLDTWTSATQAQGVLVAMGRVFVTGTAGSVYMLDPTQAAGAVTTVATVGTNPLGIAFDGGRIWTANYGGAGVSIVTPGSTLPWSVSTVTTGFGAPRGIVFDGSSIWVTDSSPARLLKLDSGGAIVQTVAVANQTSATPQFPAFDGRNIWVPAQGDNSLTVVRASDGTVLKVFGAATNGLDQPVQAAFDGQRILVTNSAGGVSLFRATDLSVIANPTTAGIAVPWGVCSDGINFWVTDIGGSSINRF